MRKLWKQVLALTMCAACAIPAVGCKPKVDNSSETVEVFAYNAGYGLDWLYAAEKIFEERTNYKMEIKEQGSDALEPKIKAGPKTTTDLFIVGEFWERYINLGSKAVAGYDYCLEPLDDVYNTTLEGEEQTIGEKMWETVNQSYEMEVYENGEYVNHHYAMPWAAGIAGIFYNKDIYAAAELTHEPRTTDELMRYCETLKNKSVTPFIYSAGDDYFSYTFNIWWAQYETIKGVENFFNGKVSDIAIPDPTTSLGVFDQEGIRETLKVFEEMLHKSKGYVDPLSESYEYTTAQAKFLNGNAAMLPTGDWLENEMKKSSSSLKIGNIVPMKTPIISALSDKLSYWAESGNFTEASKTMSEAKRKEYDDKLCAVVDYVDGVTTEKPSFANDKDVEIVRTARKVNTNVAQSHTMVIPVYSTAKEGAKEFLKFMASDEGIALFLNKTSGSALPYDFDLAEYDGYDSLSPFAKQKWEILTTSDFVPPYQVFPTHYLGSFSPRYGSGLLGVTFGSQDDAVLKTADQIVQSGKDAFRNRMDVLLKNAGLI
ncbi:MAG: hypothetical protein DBX59_05135 [Bacillota bacterium]|nr:MAG: hypothetical protein DBX59_05135 [Bacillota bacterium]